MYSTHSVIRFLDTVAILQDSPSREKRVTGTDDIKVEKFWIDVFELTSGTAFSDNNGIGFRNRFDKTI